MTTVGTGSGSSVEPSADATDATDATLRDLPADECWRLARANSVGRLAVIDHRFSTRGPSAAIVPVNYLVHDGAIFFRSGPGSKMMALTQHPGVAFEIDGHHCRRFWSVILHGSAHRLNVDADIEASGIQELDAFHDDDKNNFVRIDVESITGRSFLRRPAHRLRGALHALRVRARAADSANGGASMP